MEAFEFKDEEERKKAVNAAKKASRSREVSFYSIYDSLSESETKDNDRRYMENKLLTEFFGWKEIEEQNKQNKQKQPDVGANLNIDSNGLRLSANNLIEPTLKSAIQAKMPGYVAVEMSDDSNMQYEVSDFLKIIDAVEDILKQIEDRMERIREAYKDDNKEPNFEQKLLPLVASVVVWDKMDGGHKFFSRRQNSDLDDYPNREYMVALIRGRKTTLLRGNPKYKELDNRSYIFSLRAVLQRLGYRNDVLKYIEYPTNNKEENSIFDNCFFLVNIGGLWYGLNQTGYCKETNRDIKKFNQNGASSLHVSGGSMAYNPQTQTRLIIAQLPDKEAEELYNIASGKKITKQKEPQKTKETPKSPEERRDERRAKQAAMKDNATFRRQQKNNNFQLRALSRQKDVLEGQIARKRRELIGAQMQARTRNTKIANDALAKSQAIMQEIDTLSTQLETIEDALDSAKNERIDIQYQKEIESTGKNGIFSLFGGGDNR